MAAQTTRNSSATPATARRSSGYGAPGAVARAPRPTSGAQYANPYQVGYNAGRPAQRPAQRPQPQAAPVAKPAKKEVPVKKNKRREKDYFFVMRRGVCFVIMLLALVWVAVFALNYLAILPEYTSFLVEPDLTPVDERLETETGELDENGDAIIALYEDKSTYITFIDPIFGALKKFAGLEMTDDEGNGKSPFYDATVTALTPEETPETEEPVAEAAEEDAEEEEEAPAEETPAVEPGVAIDPAAREEDGMTSIASMAFTYFPLVLVLGAVMALVIIIIAFLALFGRRIFKGFGALSIIMLLGGVAALVAGMAAMGNHIGNPSYAEDGTLVSVIDFGQITSFLTGAFSGPPETALDPLVDVMPLTMVAGYGLLAVLVIPVVMVVLSIFARKKVPYSIFDK